MLTGLKQRGTRWYLRRRVPAEYVETWGSPEVTRALGVSDYKEARKLVPRVWAALDAEFAARELAAKGVPAPLPVSPSDRPHRYATMTRDEFEWEQENAAFISREIMEEEFEREELEGVEQRVLARLQDPKAELTDEERAIRNLLKHQSWKADLAGEQLQLARVQATPAAPTSAPAQADENPTISELHAAWLKYQERPPSTVKGMQRAVDRFVQVIGDKSVSAITRRDVTVFTDKLREPGAVTPEGVSIPTTNTTLSLLSALCGFAVKRNLIETNPARGTQLKDTRRAREKRREFDADALKAIFGSAVYAADERPEGGAGEAVYWLPLLALYTGARINELCQLHPGDVAQEGYADAKGKAQKAWVIRIEHDTAKGKRVKTEGSERRIPVHPDLVKLGFVKYAQAQAGKALLFDKLSMGPKETRLAGNWGRWFARYMRNTCGVTDERMTFHSFRHTFKHHMRVCQIPKDVNDALTGHETGDAADAYGGLSFPLLPLVEGMKRYRVDGFTLPPAPPAYR